MPQINPTYGIKSPTPFGQLVTFAGTSSFGFDELHGISNVSKMFFDMVSPRYSDPYKYYGRESEYIFELGRNDFVSMQSSINASRQYIPTGTFQGSWQGVNPANVKSLYRSVDWIEWFLYVVPTLLVPCFRDTELRKAVLGLVRGCALSMNWEITTTDLNDIDS